MQQNGLQTLIARHLRQNAARADQLLWAALRNRQVAGRKFRRKAPVGPFIVDFLCAEVSLIVDIPQCPDPARDAWLRSRGYVLLCLSDQDIRQRLPDCLRRLTALMA